VAQPSSFDFHLDEPRRLKKGNMKERILFVDDDPSVLKGLERMLHCMRNEWDMVFVESGEKALEALSDQPFSVIVTDMRMPGMNGAELLNQVMRRYPNTIRFILSGYSDQQLILESVGSAHQYLSKPCDSARLTRAVERACSLRRLLTGESVVKIALQLRSLPSLPQVYFQLLDELQSEDASMSEIGEIISKDIGMTAKILQLVNSAFFGLPHHVSNPAQAASLLGIEIIRSLMLTVRVFSEFKQEGLTSISVSTLWRHSITVGAYAKRIAEIEGCEQKMISDALTAGLLHDAGKLMLAANLPEQYSSAFGIARQKEIPLNDAEYDTFGTTHAEIGAYLLGLWAFPDPVVEAVAFHHHPDGSPASGFSPLTAVHVADALDHKTRVDREAGTVADADLSYLARLDLADRLPLWSEACQSVTEKEGMENECTCPIR
jgi:putative nucleotidyltransferase with HDIG domain